MTQPLPGLINSPANITPTQDNHQIYRKVNKFIRQYTYLADTEAVSNSAIETMLTSTTTT